MGTQWRYAHAKSLPRKSRVASKPDSQTSKRRRQLAFCVRVWVVVLFFGLFAAPFELHVSWFTELADGNPQWLSSIFGSGPMFFYAITLSIEGIFRMEHYPNLGRYDWKPLTLKVSLFFAFMIAMVGAMRLRDSPASTQQWVVYEFQLAIGLTAMLLSVVTHFFLMKYELTRVR